MNKLRTDVQCPFCGDCVVRYVGSDWKSVRCYVCKQPLFLKYATDRPNGVDKNGFARLAHEPFKWNEDVMEFDEVFG